MKKWFLVYIAVWANEATSVRNSVRGVPSGFDLPPHGGDPSLPSQVDSRVLPGQVKNRPSLIDYNSVADTAAMVTSPDQMARFTVLTSRLIRMEYAHTAGTFEDHSTIAILNRNLPVPKFSTTQDQGKLTIATDVITLTYTLGQAFSSSSLSVTSNNASSAFKRWSFGDPFPGNLLGTIRGLDQQDNTPLNCTENKLILDNGEFNHCEWAVISRDGWAVYDDSSNYILDKQDWWVPNNNPPTPRKCYTPSQKTDVISSSRSTAFPDGTTATSAEDCCNKCMSAADCVAWVWESDGANNCWPLAGWGGNHAASNRIFGQVAQQTGHSLQNSDQSDLYGFFHGHDYFGALKDFTEVSGKTIMVPKYASGIWWSRWFDLNNLDLVKVTEDYGSRSIPLDVFVIDMDWHTKDDWSGFTFDNHLFPHPKDSMDYLHALGLPVTLNIHDASGVNDWDAMFPALRDYLGLPADSKKVPFNIANATVAYGVEDIVLGDLLYKKHVDFWWIDWQQGGSQGGMTGYKQNPTIWLAHLRCTDRHRVGDNTRGITLARWGGLGGHRYQVGFSGDVKSLTWQNLAYQPYFSATAANVGHGFWSHDIEGPGDDMEMYTRWIQIGAFSGTMRSHDRGMSAGGCANSDKFSCSIVEPWNIPNSNYPDTFMEANRGALQFRATLLPYIYNGHRAAFETGVGLIRPMYYHFPENAAAYGMDKDGNNVQYMFGPSIIFSPVVAPSNSSGDGMGAGLAAKTTWLPPGKWVDANSGVTTTVTSDNHFITKEFAINQIPLWFEAGSVIPYLPIRSIASSVGNAAKQYTFLGFKFVGPFTDSGSGSTEVYEDDGTTTAYLTDKAYATTTAKYATSGNTMTVSISTSGTFPELPQTRSYQLHLLNSAPVTTVTVNGKSVPYNRFGKVAANKRIPAASQHYWDFSYLPHGMGAVIDVVGVSTSSPVSVSVTFDSSVASLDGVYGAITHALWAKLNLDIERSTPGSHHDDMAFTSVLSSVGQSLEYLAGTDTKAFSTAISSIPGLLSNATTEVLAMKSKRKTYSADLLKNAML
mmetsp:Transcript_38622/g.76005  ORF Transcript_38622/g.76005 Transcript_38622/m.76005 type:complete len:1047 (+) Transcript_38622:22-3162(+)|eukprot:CAMPEP_0175128474 /NCGR_PEP_ID=MMETSP0087-20121206/4946_1 /TAXON_ID=136419 /ORGANISM="Unknown Unknown, Strain D1" /LENGTH=1046 /DNA_ID=CAMNT_0016410535 /DNA_START=13 /DNA_END=3153 /DNA_ORIENTATION=+